MSEIITLDSLQDNLQFFYKMYDMVRLVDPVQKRVMEFRNHGIGKTCKSCYAYWGNGHICDNCISVRAYYEQRSFMKLEQGPNTVMLVMALPIESSEQPVVLEFLKNATDTMIIGPGDYQKNQALYTAVQNINNLMIRDELTSLYNRRFLDDRLPAEIVNAKVRHLPLSVIFIDIDNMKTINDTFGHTAGDQLLRHTAKILKKSLSSGEDWIARYGGDEFLICLHHSDTDSALCVSKRISRNLEQTKFSIRDSQIHAQVSQGVVTMPETGLTANEIIELADQKMYEVKKRRKAERK